MANAGVWTELGQVGWELHLSMPEPLKVHIGRGGGRGLGSGAALPMPACPGTELQEF